MSALKFNQKKDLENVDVVTSFWFRTIVKNDSVSIDDIINVIFQFFQVIIDLFDPELLDTNYMELSNDNTTLTMKSVGSKTAYGLTFIPSMENVEYIWYIKNVSCDVSKINSINIGVSDATLKQNSQGLMDKESASIHLENGLLNNNLKSTKGSISLRSGWKCIGDILTMKLVFKDTMKYGELIMNINDDEEVIIADKITRKEGLSYKLAVFLHQNGSAVQIIS